MQEVPVVLVALLVPLRDEEGPHRSFCCFLLFRFLRSPVVVAAEVVAKVELPVFRRAAADGECSSSPAAAWVACLGCVVRRGVRHALVGSAAGSVPLESLAAWLVSPRLSPLSPCYRRSRWRAGSVPDPPHCLAGLALVETVGHRSARRGRRCRTRSLSPSGLALSGARRSHTWR